MAVIHFDIDEKRSILSVDAWMRMAWNDNHLKWDPAEFEGLTQMHFGEHELWRPDIQLYNRLEKSLDNEKAKKNTNGSGLVD